ncbi:hypothetical protein [Marinilabilia salmonicolor]|uniref:hypothetical protein n=1 Tax=Marinilabilia salmonicolor TaxID=989 RepID=UPI001F30D771|nr:hypothetical protein [Marinilabilia salmonicolor]
MKKKTTQSTLLFFIGFLTLTSAPLKGQNSYDDEKMLVSLDSLNFPTVHLGEVVIKSAREQRPLQELPISTSLIPVDQIEQEQVTGLTDLTSGCQTYICHLTAANSPPPSISEASVLASTVRP